MNVLFLLENDPCSLLGGTDRVTLSLSDSFSRRGVHCSLAYFKGPKSEHSDFNGERICIEELLNRGLSDFDIVLSNLSDSSIKRKYLADLYALAKQAGAGFISFYHQMPGEDLIGSDINTIIRHIFQGRSVSRELKLLLLSLIPQSAIRFIFKKKISRKYLLTYENCDFLILHSEKVFHKYSELCGIELDSKKLIAIPNSLSYNDFIEPDKIVSKKKEVLIVARLEERQKRISIALKIWKAIMSDDTFCDWKLNIVGAGPDMNYYKSLSSRLGIDSSVRFIGPANPEKYYRDASIFLMTSAFESWGLTLTEAQQFGCVPVAFDSYPSLTEIIENDANGIIVPERSVNQYVDSLKRLMSDEHYRLNLADNAIASAHRFEPAKIADMWIKLFEPRLTQI